MGFIDTIVNWITNLMQTIGGPGVFLAIFIENIFPPIPSELVLPLAGFTAAQPDPPYGVVAAIIWATAGSVVGAILLYGLGAAFGLRRIRAVAERMPLVDATDVDNAMGWFHRHGPAAIFTGRLVPGIRSVISIPAGVDRMPMVRFLAYTTAGSAIWNTLLVVAGYMLGDNWHVVTEWMERFSTVVKIILALIVLATIVWLVRRAIRRSKAGGDDREGDGSRDAHGRYADDSPQDTDDSPQDFGGQASPRRRAEDPVGPDAAVEVNAEAGPRGGASAEAGVEDPGTKDSGQDGPRS